MLWLIHWALFVILSLNYCDGFRFVRCDQDHATTTILIRPNGAVYGCTKDENTNVYQELVQGCVLDHDKNGVPQIVGGNYGNFADKMLTANNAWDVNCCMVKDHFLNPGSSEELNKSEFKRYIQSIVENVGGTDESPDWDDTAIKEHNFIVTDHICDLKVSDDWKQYKVVAVGKCGTIKICRLKKGETFVGELITVSEVCPFWTTGNYKLRCVRKAHLRQIFQNDPEIENIDGYCKDMYTKTRYEHSNGAFAKRFNEKVDESFVEFCDVAYEVTGK